MKKPNYAGSGKPTKDIEAFQRCIHGQQRPESHFYVTLLGLRTFDPLKLLKRVESGFSYSTIERFQRNFNLSRAELSELVQISLRTLRRRKEEGRLRPDESDRLLRVSRIFGMALELFEGDVDAATNWLSSSQLVIAGTAPLELTKTNFGAREVENLIGRLENGVFS